VTYLDDLEHQEWDREKQLLDELERRHALTCDGCVVDMMRNELKQVRREARRAEREALVDAVESLVLLGLDPGGTTGWCLMVFNREAFLDPTVKILDNITMFTLGQITGDEHAQVDEIEAMLDVWPGAAVVCEDFILRTLNKNRDVLSPVRLTFGIQHLLHARGRVAFLQQPAMAKTTATDERLKAWGLYRPGEEHARDATRHCITFARRVKDQRGLLLKAWPNLKDDAVHGI